VNRTFTLQDENGRRPVYGGTEKFQTDPHWRDLILFHEYFHGNTGAVLGASHQTGWTGIVAKTIQLFDLLDAEKALAGGKITALGRYSMKAITMEPKKPGTVRYEDIPEPYERESSILVEAIAAAVVCNSARVVASKLNCRCTHASPARKCQRAPSRLGGARWCRTGGVSPTKYPGICFPRLQHGSDRYLQQRLTHESV